MNTKPLGPMKNPPHPGQIIRDDILADLHLTVTGAAGVLGVSRKTLSELLNGRAGISPEMAVRLEKAFGSTARLWLDLQLTYDLAQVETDTINVRRYTPPPTTEPQPKLI